MSTFIQKLFRGEVPIPRRDADLCKGWWSDVAVTRRIRKVLGVTETMPKNFGGEFNVDGRYVVVFRSGRTPKGGLLRTYIEANDGRLVPAGRLTQAVCPLRRKRR
jgi:hypothetical protein